MNTRFLGLGASAALRWYFRQRVDALRNRNKGKLNGQYLELSSRMYMDNASRSMLNDPVFRVQWWAHQLSVGIQRRILERGYVDVSAGIGTTRIRENLGILPAEEGSREFFYGVQAKLGLAFGGERQRIPEAARCDAFRYYFMERFMWKIGLLNVLNGNSKDGFEGVWNLDMNGR